ncbi:arylsulfatase [Sediminitomix flava]|uniref:Arylsulfatase n=2 Tax=Sediminitomix flava TaxID=379075 RepID=A0A315YXX7_SEDFL|nr:arylsulfatase [Sediminitomix flava]
MKRFLQYILLVLSVGGGLQACQGISQKTFDNKAIDERPNIIVMLVDDMGYSDLGSYGGEIQTPNLDKIANNGIRFTQFYNTSRCCPTRASLLTGLYPHQAGIGQMTGNQHKPGYEGQIKKTAVTIAEVLKDAGYATGMVGKWHVSNTSVKKNSNGQDRQAQLDWLNHQAYLNDDFGPLEAYPTARGFDKYYGNIWGVVNFFDPFSLVNGIEPVKKVPEDYYHTTALSDSAVNYIEEFSKSEKPFFMYVAHTAPHWPLHALPEDIAKYENTYNGGWDEIRKARFNRMKEIGIISENVELPSPQRKIKKWENNPNKDYDAHKMAVHAAMIDRIDQGVGKMLKKLEETGELENTVILFMSDNGASSETPMFAGFDRNGQTRSGEKVIYTEHKKDVMPGDELTYAGIGQEWANVANTPLRYWKAKTFEGGICTPMIAYWEKGIRKQKGTINHSSGHVIDIMATCVELANTEYPKSYKGNVIQPLEGKSLVPIFEEGKRVGHEAIFFEHYWSAALRSGDWKLVSLPLGDWELYNLKEDRNEMKNVIDLYPAIAEDLKNKWEQGAQRTMVFPRPKMPKHIKKQANKKDS